MKDDSKRILMWFVAFVVIIGAFLVVIVNSISKDPDIGRSVPLTPVAEDEWWRGNQDSDIILLEYSDFQCPACKSREPIIEDLLTEFGSHIRFVYRHFPITSLHENAEAAARASEAAGLQGKFWEMHDLIFENQSNWGKQSGSGAQATFTAYAVDLGLDIDKFKADLDSDFVEDSVDEDYESGLQAGVNGTPTFFLNGVKLNPRSIDDFRAIIREAIKNAS